MRTDELIQMLSTNLEPVDRGQFSRTIALALAVGVAAVLAAIVPIFGVRSDLSEAGAIASLLLKLVFTLGLVGLASTYLLRLARPGGELNTPVGWVSVPFAIILLLAGIGLAFAPPPHWQQMMMGNQWLECLVSILIIAIVPFAAVVWAVRRCAPTDLTRAGALAGVVAGSLSATGYALHCTDDSLAFIALWYGGTIGICTWIGAKLGPRLLRW